MNLRSALLTVVIAFFGLVGAQRVIASCCGPTRSTGKVTSCASVLTVHCYPASYYCVHEDCSGTPASCFYCGSSVDAH
jgi:hypothetical protein